MPVHNAYIAALFDELADLLEIDEANPFRVRAYRNAARVVGTWPETIADMVKRGEDLTALPGIGKDLAGKIAEIARAGRLGLLDEEARRVPRSLRALMHLPGVGPKRARAIWQAFGAVDLRKLETLAVQGRLREIPGFGEKTERAILDELKSREEGRAEGGRTLLPVAEQVLAPLAAHLKGAHGVSRVEAAGSFRRRLETVADLDILVTGDDALAAMERLASYEEVERVLARGETKSTVLLRSGMQVDVRAVARSSFGAALLYFTGSKAHNIALRALALKRGLKINEYGLFRGGRKLAGRAEQEIYAALDLAFIEPELRENRGEIEAAREGKLPKLVVEGDLKGDLHAHTTETDGKLSLEEMAREAERLGYEYLAITDHTKRLTVARGLNVERLSRQLHAIDRLNARLKKLRILKSSEVDILEDGSLDLPDEWLRELDLAVCSVHHKFNLTAAKQTERIIRAMDNPYCSILGHPTGRLIGTRDAYEVDLERVIAAAAERGVCLELNAQPERFDLSDTNALAARRAGALVAISTDAHSGNDLHNMRFGVAQARRAWLEKRDVLNTRGLAELLRLLARRKSRAAAAA
jgi:DNA polymerase (family 10)